MRKVRFNELDTTPKKYLFVVCCLKTDELYQSFFHQLMHN